MWRAWKKQDLQVQLGDWHMLVQETLGREKLVHQHQNRELMGWREQPACSPKASWGPTCIIIYQGKALLGLHHLPSETSVFTVVPCLGSVDVGSPGSPVGCCYVLCAITLHGPMGRDALPVLGLSSASPLFRQVAVFCFLGPAKHVPTGGLSDSAS